MFEPGVVLADGEFSQLEGVVLGAPLGMTNNYMKAVAYNEVRARGDACRAKHAGCREWGSERSYGRIFLDMIQAKRSNGGFVSSLL